MLLHHYYSDPWYAEQALALEAGVPRSRDDSPPPIIPLNWILNWCVAVWGLAAALGGLIKWLA